MHPSWNEYPHLIAELDPDGNKALTYRGKSVLPLELSVGTGFSLDWKCITCYHQWRAIGYSRSKQNGVGCPFCAGQTVHSDGHNSMAATHPKLSAEYQGDATKITAGTSKKLDWKCSICVHEWQAAGHSRTTRGLGCPACANKAVHIDGRNSLLSEHPELAKECLEDASKIISKTSRKIKWKCSTCDNEWQASSYARVSKQHGCPACSNTSVHIDGRNSMAKTHPHLADELQNMDPNKLIAGTAKKLNWECSTCEHQWKATGNDRVSSKTGCPHCAHNVLHSDGRNSMAKTHPELAQEYQGDATKLIAGTTQKLLWKCPTCEYKWKTNGRNRVHGRTGCPACAPTGFQPDKIGYYYVHSVCNFNGEVIMYKAGISNDWKRRLRQLRRKSPKELLIKPYEVIDFEIGQEARDLETTLLRMAAEEGWKAPPRDFDGGHELFLENPLDHARFKGLLSPKHNQVDENL